MIKSGMKLSMKFATLMLIVLSVFCAANFAQQASKVQAKEATASKTNSAKSAERKQQIADLKKIIKTLCSDEFEGRGAGTKGIIKARDYIANQFKEIGLKPAIDKSYNQPFEFQFGDKIKAKEFKLHSINGKTKTELNAKDFMVLGCGKNTKFTLPISFAGYGIRSVNRKYNSYKSIAPGDLKGRAVIVFRGSPANAQKGFNRKWSSAASLSGKISTAKKAGASAVIVVEPKDYKFRRKYFTGILNARYYRNLTEIPIVRISYEAFLNILKKQGIANPKKHAAKLLKSANKGTTKVQNFDKLKLSGTIEVAPRMFKVDNVIGVLPGKGDLAKEVIVIGGHYDHLGAGKYPNSTRDKPQKDKFYVGADDNASGTAGVIMLAKKLSAFYKKADIKNCRTIVFACFAGEECGLWGSKKFVKDIKEIGFERKQVVSMFNLDMIGYMRNSKLYLMGSTTGLEFESYIEKINKEQALRLKIKQMNMPFGFSDHASFISGRIPSVMFSTGTHTFYHTLADRPNKINHSGTLRIISLVEGLTKKISVLNRRISFNPYSKRGKIYLGLRFNRLQRKKCVISKVVSGGPAQKAGLKVGDTIVTFDGKPVVNKRKLIRYIKRCNVGQKVKMCVLRKNKKIDLTLIIGKR